VVVEQKKSEIKGTPFKLYTWEYMEGGNMTTNPRFNIDLITHDNDINGQAYNFRHFNGLDCPKIITQILT